MIMAGFIGFLFTVLIKNPNLVSGICFGLGAYSLTVWGTTAWHDFLEVATLEKDPNWRYKQTRLEILQDKLDLDEELTEEEIREYNLLVNES